MVVGLTLWGRLGAAVRSATLFDVNLLSWGDAGPSLRQRPTTTCITQRSWHGSGSCERLSANSPLSVMPGGALSHLTTRGYGLPRGYGRLDQSGMTL